MIESTEEQITRLYDFLCEEIPGAAEVLLHGALGDEDPGSAERAVSLAMKLLDQRVIAADVPIFIVKGTDNLALAAMNYYAQLCRSNGLFSQAKEVEKAIDEMADWQRGNQDRVKQPHHKHVPVSGLTPPDTFEPGLISKPDTIEPGNITPKE